jgi:hypothetical protein
MSDISPKLNSPDHPNHLSPERANDILNTASALKNAIDSLATSIVRGSGIQRAAARDQFDIALTEFSQAIDQTAE